MPSTVIRRLDYVPEARQLIVELVTGRSYVYSDVPEHEVEGLRSAFAKGVYFNRRIRSRYAYRERRAREAMRDAPKVEVWKGDRLVQRIEQAAP